MSATTATLKIMCERCGGMGLRGGSHCLISGFGLCKWADGTYRGIKTLVLRSGNNIDMSLCSLPSLEPA